MKKDKSFLHNPWSPSTTEREEVKADEERESGKPFHRFLSLLHVRLLLLLLHLLLLLLLVILSAFIYGHPSFLRTSSTRKMRERRREKSDRCVYIDQVQHWIYHMFLRLVFLSFLFLHPKQPLSFLNRNLKTRSHSISMTEPEEPDFIWFHLLHVLALSSCSWIKRVEQTASESQSFVWKTGNFAGKQSYDWWDVFKAWRHHPG